MAIKYIDFKNGNDANDGLSFANRVKSFSGLGISQVENAAGSSVDIQGDEIRVMGMEPVNVGNATWTKGGYNNFGSSGEAHYYDSSDGATAGTPITITANNHSFVTGDVCLIYGIKGIPEANGIWIVTKTGTNTFTLNNSTGTGTYTGRQHSNNLRRLNNKAIKVNTDCKRIAFCSGSCPAVGNDTVDKTDNDFFGVLSSNVSIDQTQWNLIQRSGRINISDSFTTGKVMYFTLPATCDLSAYQKISFNLFHYENQNARVETSHLSLKLCTDTTGDVVAHSCDIGGHYQSGHFPHVFDFGTNLNSAIKSIAIYSDTDVGLTRIRIDNIIALKNTNATVSHRDVIGKNTTAEPVWWQVKYIQEDLMFFGPCSNPYMGDVLGTSGNCATYAGTSETVALYRATPFDVIQDGQDFSADGHENKYIARPSYDGRQSNAITKIRGGWNESDMTTQNCVTWMNFYRRNSQMLSRGSNGNTNNMEVENFGVSGTSRVVYMNFIQNQKVKNIYAVGHRQNSAIGFANHSNEPAIIDGLYQTMGAQHGWYLADSRHGIDQEHPVIILKNVHLYGVGNISFEYISPYGGTIIIEDITIKGSRWMLRSNSITLGRILIKNFVGSGFEYYMSAGADIQIHNSSIENVIYEVYPHTINEKGSNYNGRLCFRNYNGVANDHRIITDGGCIKSETSVRHGTDGIAWKIQPKREHTGSNAQNPKANTDTAPFYLKVASLFVNASKLVTVKAFLRRDNTGITARIAARQKYSPFTVSTDQVATMTAAADTWQEVTLSFTPINEGELNIVFEAFGGNSYNAYIDSVSVTQAP